MRRAGNRRHQVALQHKTVATSTTGFTEPYATYATVYAEVLPAGAAPVERSIAATRQTPITHLVELDYRSDLVATDRVLLGSRALYVQGVQNVEERNKTHVLSCEERAA